MGGDQKGENRVQRGGSWINNAGNCRSANRNSNHPGNRNDNIGFRLSRARQGMDALLTRSPSCPFVIETLVPCIAFGKKKRLSGMLVGGAERNRTLAGLANFFKV